MAYSPVAKQDHHAGNCCPNEWRIERGHPRNHRDSGDHEASSERRRDPWTDWTEDVTLLRHAATLSAARSTAERRRELTHNAGAEHFRAAIDIDVGQRAVVGVEVGTRTRRHTRLA